MRVNASQIILLPPHGSVGDKANKKAQDEAKEGSCKLSIKCHLQGPTIAAHGGSISGSSSLMIFGKKVRTVRPSDGPRGGGCWVANQESRRTCRLHIGYGRA